MKILLVSGPGISLKEPFNSGIEAFIVSFALQLIEAGHEVDVIAAEAEASKKFNLLNPFTSSITDNPDFFKRIKERRQFKKLDVEKYDVIHYHMFYPHLLKTGLNFKKPIFLTLHSPADKQRVAVYKKLSRGKNITFVAISERVKEQWDQALGMDIPLINNGIDMDLWPIKKSGDREYLLWSARINQKKNVVDAINLAKHMQVRLKIAGRIADQSYFDSDVKPHLNSEIEYVGHLTQRELSRLSRHATGYLVTATWQEPFGLAALEMLASGVPVIGYNTAVPPDWSDESVLTTSSLQWQDLVALVEKSRSVNSDNCREFASSMSIQQMTENYLKLYRKVLFYDMDEQVKSADRLLTKSAIETTEITG
ncbi:MULTISPECIES: glycosyltransferase [Pedobacter]|uniref:glycosyltransferase n=1 Tax=Pedobacter TaxID=84567 RepID=UPI001E4E68BB|nr:MULTISPECIES: glycosyltransferase [Pedobacter]